MPVLHGCVCACVCVWPLQGFLDLHQSPVLLGDSQTRPPEARTVLPGRWDLQGSRNPWRARLAAGSQFAEESLRQAMVVWKGVHGWLAP